MTLYAHFSNNFTEKNIHNGRSNSRGDHYSDDSLNNFFFPFDIHEQLFVVIVVVKYRTKPAKN